MALWQYWKNQRKQFLRTGNSLSDHLNILPSTSDGNFYAQIMVTMFFIYGTIIIANLITAWIVVNQKDANTEIILAKQRIEEITGSSEVSKEFPQAKEKRNDIPVWVSISDGHWQISIHQKLCEIPIPETRPIRKSYIPFSLVENDSRSQ